MKQEDRDRLIEAFFTECVELVRRKGEDYNLDDDAYSNFEEAGRAMNLKTEIIMGVYMDKHWQAIKRYLRDGVTSDESIQGRLMDLANYCAILAVYAGDQERGRS